jgi:DNA polymerase III gamma/tau subunit
MTIKASARSALIFAAGLLVSFAGPPPAMAAGTDADSATVSKSESATSGQSVRQGSRYLKKRYTHRKDTHAASRSDEGKKADEKQVADASSGSPTAIPQWLANANAQMTATDPAPDSARDTAKGMSAAMSEKANTVLQAAADKPADAEAPADTAAAASDQLNDVDRALHKDVDKALQEAPSSQTVAMASAIKPATEAAAQAANNDSSTLDKTSLIGKIFIAFGALLTMASAARMFMA